MLSCDSQAQLISIVFLKITFFYLQRFQKKKKESTLINERGPPLCYGRLFSDFFCFLIQVFVTVTDLLRTASFQFS